MKSQQKRCELLTVLSSFDDLLSNNRPLSPRTWHDSLAESIRDPEILLAKLGLPPEYLPPARAAAQLFALRVPLSFVARMQAGDPNDPLLRQVLPIQHELAAKEGFTTDAVGDCSSRRAPGLLHKYHGRALLIVTGSCAVHCRYCFRRHYPYESEPRRLDDWKPAWDLLQADQSIHEVLLSGGDPLMLTDGRLKALIERLAEIPHVKRLRIHSRLPIVLPDRITAPLLELLTATRLTPIMVVHANHPQEIVNDCDEALRKLVRAGITTLNQTVLLRGINDCVETLENLSERLIDTGVIPYYLHQLDRVDGAAHFEVNTAKGCELIKQLQKRLPGYAVPRYVQEIAGAAHKLGVEAD